MPTNPTWFDNVTGEQKGSAHQEAHQPDGGPRQGVLPL